MNIKISARQWVIGYLSITAVILLGIGVLSVRIDPFFHYHKPLTDKYYYVLDNERSQNNGIMRNFSYEGLITGTSMAQNFKTSEAEKIFNISFIKACFSGGSFKEINDNLKVALKENKDLKMVIRAIDLGYFISDKDYVNERLGIYPEYLYDNKLYNDVKYVYNRDIVFSRIYTMVKGNLSGKQGGMTSFDDYSNWMKFYTFGIRAVYPDGITVKTPETEKPLSSDDAYMVRENVIQNITLLPEQYPDVSFYFFLTPYSVAWWQSAYENGEIRRIIEAEKIGIEEMLKHDNIKVFLFDDLTEIATDLNNYKDPTHYGEWVNSMILEHIASDSNRLSMDNYESKLHEVYSFYSDFDYLSLNVRGGYGE